MQLIKTADIEGVTIEILKSFDFSRKKEVFHVTLQKRLLDSYPTVQEAEDEFKYWEMILKDEDRKKK